MSLTDLPTSKASYLFATSGEAIPQVTLRYNNWVSGLPAHSGNSCTRRCSSRSSVVIWSLNGPASSVCFHNIPCFCVLFCFNLPRKASPSFCSIFLHNMPSWSLIAFPASNHTTDFRASFWDQGSLTHVVAWCFAWIILHPNTSTCQKALSFWCSCCVCLIAVLMPWPKTLLCISVRWECKSHATEHLVQITS